MKPFQALWRALPVLMVLLAAPRFSPAADDDKTPARKPLPIEQSFEESPKVEVVADQLEYSRDQKTVTARKNVVVRYQDIQLTADEAQVETETKKAAAKGHVILFQNGEPRAQGTEVHFDFAHSTGKFFEARAINPPWVAAGREMEQVRKGVKVIHNGTVTTCDRENPHYEVRAERITVYDGDKIVARRVTLRVLGKPIFWWPVVVLPTRNDPLAVNAGYNTRYGAFLETSKGMSLTKNIGAKAHLDWRSKRGIGGGGDLDYHFGKKGRIGRGIVKGYVTQDKRAPTPGLKNPYSQLESRTRGRISWVHRTDLDDYSHAMLRYNRLADEFFLQDFFQKEFRADTQPQSFVTLTKNSQRYGLLAHVERHMNGFESLVERLPEIDFDWRNQPFLKPWLFYESRTGMANLRKRFGRLALPDEDALRYDTFHEWSVPMNWHDIKFTPFTNLRGTYYSRERNGPQDRFRTVFGGGADLRTQLYKTFPVTTEKWGVAVNQLRHVLEPSFQYRTVKPTLGSERFASFDAADRLDDADSVTFGIENRLQTKRVIRGRMQRVDLVSLNTFVSMEWREDPGTFKSSLTTTEEGRTASNTPSSTAFFNQEVVLRPYEWLQYQTRFDYDMRLGRFHSFNQDLLLRTKRFQVLFGHRFVRDLGSFQGGDNQFVFDGKWVVNPLWTLGGYFRWDPDSSGREEWQVAATRDLHDFLLDFGYNVRNSSIQNSTKELFFNFRMKAFPRIELRAGHRASFSEPRIGDTVAGVSQAPGAFQEGTAGGAFS